MFKANEPHNVLTKGLRGPELSVSLNNERPMSGDDAAYGRVPA